MARAYPFGFCFVVATSALVVSTTASLRSLAVEGGQENLPDVEIRLVPPSNPWPQVSAEIGSLERSREMFEAQQMDIVISTFNAELLSAKARISEVVGRAMKAFDGVKSSSFGKKTASLLALGYDPAEKFTVKVNVVGISDPDPSIKDKIDAIERKRADQEKLMFEQVSSDWQGLTDTVVNELEVQLQRNINACLGGRLRGKAAGLLQMPDQIKVHVKTPEASYPTISSLVQDMEQRRDTSERLGMARTLELELKLLKAENDMIKDSLRLSVERIVGS